MGKPIAGQNQFPYTVGGFLVDGANINGTTYSKSLFIYRQRSMLYYDLMDTHGNIYQFIKIGYKNTDGDVLNYFDVDENLVQTIPVNTFFLKIQDASRDIFSFVRIYQWHKCITVEGDYVFRTSDIDPTLSGVLINPIESTVKVGDSLSYHTVFYPNNYIDTDGSWFINSLNGIRHTDIAEITSSNLNEAEVQGVKPGKAVLTFVPKRNKSLVSHSIINVVAENQSIEDIKLVLQSPLYEQVGVIPASTEYVIEVVTFPYDAIIENPLDVIIHDPQYPEMFPVSDKLISVSDDNKFYTFLSEIDFSGYDDPENETPDPEDLNVYHTYNFDFVMNDPRFTVNFTGTMVNKRYYENNFLNYQRVTYNIPYNLRPNMTYQTTKYGISAFPETYPIVSSDESIATMDADTGIVTTYDKKGNVTFSRKYMLASGEITDDQIGMMTVKDEVYDTITLEPQRVSSMNRGESIDFTFTGYREGYEPQTLYPRNSFTPDVYSVNGSTITALDTARLYSTVYVTPPADITIDTQLLSLYRSPGAKPLVVTPDTPDVPMKYMEVPGQQSINYVRLNPEGYENHFNILVFPRPNECVKYEMIIEDGYDKSVVEIIDEDYLTGTFQYAMGGTLYMFLRALKVGSTEITVRSVHYPEVFTVLKIVIF